MTHMCCPSCRLRFTRAAAAYLLACPQCGELVQAVPSALGVLGFRLFADAEIAEVLGPVVSAALPAHVPGVDPPGPPS